MCEQNDVISAPNRMGSVTLADLINNRCDLMTYIYNANIIFRLKQVLLHVTGTLVP